MNGLFKDGVISVNGKKPYRVRVVCKADSRYRFILEYKRYWFSKWRNVVDIEGNTMEYETYVEAAAAAYMTSITSLKFFN
jgi:hypothetical protein